MQELYNKIILHYNQKKSLPYELLTKSNLDLIYQIVQKEFLYGENTICNKLILDEYAKIIKNLLLNNSNSNSNLELIWQELKDNWEPIYDNEYYYGKILSSTTFDELITIMRNGLLKYNKERSLYTIEEFDVRDISELEDILLDWFVYDERFDHKFVNIINEENEVEFFERVLDCTDTHINSLCNNWRKISISKKKKRKIETEKEVEISMEIDE